MKRWHRKARQSVSFLDELEVDIAEWEAGKTTSAQLREKYAPEWQSLRKAIERENSGGPTVASDIRELPNFLRLVVLEIGPRMPGTTLDRIDNAARTYKAGALKWATPKEQALNRSTTNHYRVTLPGTQIEAEFTIPEFVKCSACPKGLKAPAIRQRLARGASPQAAFFTPKGKRVQSDGVVAVRIPARSAALRVIEGYRNAVWRYHPTMSRNLLPADREVLRRFARDWVYLDSSVDPGRAVPLILEHWASVLQRIRDTSGKHLPEKPFPSVLAKHVALIQEAYRNMRANGVKATGWVPRVQEQTSTPHLALVEVDPESL